MQNLGDSERLKRGLKNNDQSSDKKMKQVNFDDFFHKKPAGHIPKSTKSTYLAKESPT